MREKVGIVLGAHFCCIFARRSHVSWIGSAVFVGCGSVEGGESVFRIVDMNNVDLSLMWVHFSFGAQFVLHPCWCQLKMVLVFVTI